jgi:hypothetical protein
MSVTVKLASGISRQMRLSGSGELRMGADVCGVFTRSMTSTLPLASTDTNAGVGAPCSGSTETPM